MTDALPTQRQRAQPGRRRVRDVLDPLFPSASELAVTRRGVLLGLIALVAGTAVSLLRIAGTGPFQSIWEEDARAVLSDALNLNGVRAITKPVAGYYVIGPHLLGELATLFPLSWAAAVLSISSALILAVFTLQVYVASGVHIRNTLARLLVSAPLLFAPVAENFHAEIQDRPVGLHFFAMYTLFWLMLWTPRGVWGKGGLLASVAFTAFSTVLVVGYLPLAALRVYQRRDRLSWWILIVTVAGSALQLSSLAAGYTGRAEASARIDPLWAMATYVLWAVPSSVLGFRSSYPLTFVYFDFTKTVKENVPLIAVSWLVLVVFVVCAWFGARKGWLKPKLGLALLALVYGVWLNAMMVMANGAIAQRYLVPVELLLFTAVAVLLIPTSGWKPAVPLTVFAVFVLVVSAFNYRWTDTYRARSPLWTQQVAEARRVCQQNPLVSHVVVRGGPQPWWSVVYVPCHELLQGVPCAEPTCVYLDPPRSAGRRTDVAVPEATAPVG